jgi:NADH:ubiquinone oxidoreductase subunit B-like Fe-S oxidoreductase
MLNKYKNNNKYILSLICFTRMDFSEQYHMYWRWSLRQSNIICIKGEVWDRAISHVSKVKSETEQYHMYRRWSLRQSNITCIEGEVWDRAISHVSKVKSETEQYHMYQRRSLRQSNITCIKGEMWDAMRIPFRAKHINNTMFI